MCECVCMYSVIFLELHGQYQ
ncbi:hypothetical protein TSAR_001504 [Trichomalopsis sarcophagae]|uniref:Uncharacterized protein n=1 Tax=Trichomalopsis sarcophagae TaxID=543379 RepID=A0A232FBZ0_9HYME|nr:hypothetical protein TSAR_001504 [Trichomalopsis sarcophagae]